MVETIALNNPTPGNLSTGTRLGRVRWTVCAMLFAATSINYMDRQVIAILKRTLEHSIGMTEISYGYIVDAFQIAYAIGLLAAGRLIDKLGTRIGYMLVMVTWSLSAMGHALASTVLEFGFARFFLGLGESGNFPAAIKTVAEWFPQNERSLATGVFNSGANVGAILAPAIVPWVTLRYGWHAAFLTTGVFSVLWILWWFRYYRRPADHPTLTAGELRHIYQQAPADLNPSMPWGRLFSYRQTWAYSAAKFLTDPIWWFYLFWLPSYFSAKFNLNLSHLGLPLIIVYNVSALGSIGGGWLPAPFRRLGLSPNYARLAAMLFCACAGGSHLHGSSRPVEWMRHRADQRRGGRPPGLVGQSLHHIVGHVPAQRRRRGSRYRRHGGIRRQRAICLLRRPHSATHAQLWDPVWHRLQRLSVGSDRSVPACSWIEEGGIRRMSLHCAAGGVESDLFPQLQELLVESLAKLGPRSRVLVVPPDHSRVHSRSGDLTRYAWQYYGDRLQAVLPALGTHAAMQPAQIARMFGAMPQALFHVHNWRTDVETLGEVPAEFIREQSEGKLNYAWPAQVNRLITQGGFDLILSIGQVVPHEVIGMANYNKNILVGTGGRDSINRSHYLGAVYGMERIMGRADNPVRNVLNFAADRFLAASAHRLLSHRDRTH